MRAVQVEVLLRWGYAILLPPVHPSYLYICKKAESRNPIIGRIQGALAIYSDSNYFISSI